VGLHSNPFMASRTMKTRHMFGAVCLALMYVYIVGICINHVPHVRAAMSEEDIEQIEECWKNHQTEPSSAKNSKLERRKQKKLMSLYFGDAAVETLTAVDNQQISAILALAECTRQQDDTLYLPSSDFNVTYLTGTFLELLPDIHSTLLTAANHGIKKAQWEVDLSNEEDGEESHNSEIMPPIESLGIRQIQLLSLEKAGLEEYQAKLKKRAYEQRTQQAFVLHPHPSEEEFREKKNRLRAHQADGHKNDHDVFHRDQMSHPYDGSSVYTMMVILSEKEDFSGGSILVKRHASNIENPFGEEDEEEEDEEGPDPDILGSEKMHAASKIFAHSPVFSEFTPDIGSVLLIKSSHAYGITDVPVGRRNILFIEFWKYTDTTIIGHRPTKEEGVPFPPSHSYQFDL
jgi:hypothetical protein